jgi:hypothetical protein
MKKTYIIWEWYNNLIICMVYKLKVWKYHEHICHVNYWLNMFWWLGLALWCLTPLSTIVYRPILVPPVFYLLICLTDFMFVLVITIAKIQLTWRQNIFGAVVFVINDVVSEHEALIYSPFKEGVVYMFHSRSHRAQFWWSCTPQHALYKTMSNLH